LESFGDEVDESQPRLDELIAAPVTYYDGLNNDWGKTPAEMRHL
jgi:hypothetical protein